ncbi:MAG: RagB/SusD family nutrient uptake outer membrane protein [Prevotella sp.]
MTHTIRKLTWALALTCLTGCIEKENPSDVATSEQISASETAFGMLVNGLESKMIASCNYLSSDQYSTWYATQDFGYPCYILIKESLLDGYPASSTNYNYQSVYEQASNLSSYSLYPYYYYYSLVYNANKILEYGKNANGNKEIMAGCGMARAYRALAYMDLAMMFEFYRTGNEELDAKAQSVWGLTVPLVTESTTRDDAKNNPRIPFYQMYRFILNDLAQAEALLTGHERMQKNKANIDVVHGLMARFWLNLATRFRKEPNDLATQLAHEGDNDGGMALGITSANDCYNKALAYAQQVIEAGYTPTTEAQWLDSKTGFNTENQGWIWDMKYTSPQEQIYAYWCSIMGQIAAEPTWGMSNYGNTYRCISSRLYGKIQSGDWRVNAWVNPADAGAKTVPSNYHTLLLNETTASLSEQTNFSRLPAYTNLKFHPGSGNLDDYDVGLACDVPLMRVEEMYFIKVECELFLNGLQAGISALESFMNSYRMNGGSFQAQSTTESDFVYEMIAQKYIEFWGEGIMYNDYKRLRLAVTRTYDSSNYLETYQLDSKDGYCAQWLNFYIPYEERNFNAGLEGQMNPDPTIKN